LIAYKFLASGTTAPFTGFRWPAEEWVDVKGAIDPCRSGVHACRVEDLPLWIEEELWRIELGGRSLTIDGVVVAERGRLVARVASWDREVGREFALACAARARERAAGNDRVAPYANDAEAFAARIETAKEVAEVAFVAAHAASLAAPGGYEAERAWQSRWLADRLQLDD
jgi:hypothetical protein